MDQLPARIVFVDVETTGFDRYDRVVSLGLITLNTVALRDNVLDVGCMHVIFDPTRKSHPGAERVHGYCDWALRHQERFEVRAAELGSYFDAADLVVAHNSAFDMAFIKKEFRKSKVALAELPVACTMELFRRRYSDSASLDNVLQRAGVPALRDRHDALEDAWHVMQVYFWLNNLPPPPLSMLPEHPPQNWREPPPRPDGDLPLRKYKWRAGDEGPNARMPVAARLVAKFTRKRSSELSSVRG